jgi:hypothetical protein
VGIVDGDVSLPKDVSEGPSGQLPVEGDDDDLACVIAELDMTPLLADLGEPSLLQRRERFSARGDRQRRTRAGMSTGAMIRGSIPPKNGGSSK